MNVETIFGSIAGILTTISFIPQVIKIWRQKTAKDISLITFIVFTIGVFIWLLYGFMIKSWPVIISNFITFVLSLMILVFKLMYLHK